MTKNKIKSLLIGESPLLQRIFTYNLVWQYTNENAAYEG